MPKTSSFELAFPNGKYIILNTFHKEKLGLGHRSMTANSSQSPNTLQCSSVALLATNVLMSLYYLLPFFCLTLKTIVRKEKPFGVLWYTRLDSFWA